jgi:hypothetical protein
MPVTAFRLARDLRLSRFTLDVLTQRLRNLRLQGNGRAPAHEQFADWVRGHLFACEDLYTELRRQLGSFQSLEGYALAAFFVRNEDLRRRITESIGRLNSFEYGTCGIDGDVTQSAVSV